MSTLFQYFTTIRKDLNKFISREFMDSLLKMYDYTILQEVKECLYYYNKSRLSKDIQNYLFAVNFEMDTTQKCTYTGETIEINESFFAPIESWLLTPDTSKEKRLNFRAEIQKEYTTQTLTQEIIVEGKNINKTEIYEKLHDKYAFNMKDKALDPFLKNENFRRAIKDFSKKEFNTYDKKIKKDVRYLLKNLFQKFNYAELGAKEICTYVIDQNLAERFG